ncbi:hypothetical protein N7470_001452 [Penicillium chermesinum]|nr:hypothetical protein N7470_001452 [Penicillium chermesinum]
MKCETSGVQHTNLSPSIPAHARGSFLSSMEHERPSKLQVSAGCRIRRDGMLRECGPPTRKLQQSGNDAHQRQSETCIWLSATFFDRPRECLVNRR